MYAYAGVGLVVLFIVMILPVNSTYDTSIDDITHYGQVLMVYHDVNGNEKFRQTVHNQLTNDGEDYILNAVFADGTTAVEDLGSIGAICVSDGQSSSFTVADAETAGTFDGDNSLTTTNCEQSTSVGVDTTDGAGIATIGPLNFIANSGDNNVPTGTTIVGIGICQNVVANDADYTDCLTGNAGAGILFSVINTSDVTLAAGEDVDITYTFNIADNSN